jgi:hypothetical protein
MIIPNAVPSPHFGPGIREQDVADSLMEVFGLSGLEVEVPEGGTAREVMAGVFRHLGGVMGVDPSGLTDCQILDTIVYSTFPNLLPVISMVQAPTFRFRPYGSDPETSVMDIMWLLPPPDGSPRPGAAPVIWLGFDDPFADVPELMKIIAGAEVAGAADQDVANLTQIQHGLHSLAKGVTLGHYQENRIRHFHVVLDEYIRA